MSHTVIGAAIEVHRLKGPGLIESIYEKCLLRELSLCELTAVNQRIVRVEYEGFVFEEPLRFDILVEGCLLLELKSVQEILPIHKAQLLSYMIQKRRGWASAAGEARECCAKSELAS